MQSIGKLVNPKIVTERTVTIFVGGATDQICVVFLCFLNELGLEEDFSQLFFYMSSFMNRSLELAKLLSQPSN